MSYQSTTIVGNVGREVKFNEVNGTPVANFSVAVNEKYSDKEITTWFDVALWGKLAQVADHITPGRLILVEGKIYSQAWLSGDGVPQCNLQLNAQTVQLLGPKPE